MYKIGCKEAEADEELCTSKKKTTDVETI